MKTDKASFIKIPLKKLFPSAHSTDGVLEYEFSCGFMVPVLDRL